MVVVLLAAGCGHKGPPMPPALPEPATPQRVDYSAEGDTLRLIWLFPLSAPQPTAFHVLRARVDVGCSDCPPAYEVRGTVFERAGEGPYAFRDGGLSMGATYVYQIMPLFPGGIEGPPSVPLRVLWRAALPPEGVVAVATPDGVKVFWAPELGAKGYAVYRAEAGLPLQRLGEAEVPPYLDATVAPGRRYTYAVATMVKSGEGPLSASVEATALLRP